MGNYEKNLIGSAIPLMEVDDEESTLDSELIFNSEVNADLTELLDNIGKEEFQAIYQNLYNEIRALSIESKILFCEKLADKIYEVYDFEFYPKLDFNNENDVNNFLNFVEFLEFNYVSQLALIISGLDMNKLRRNFDLFFEEYEEQIMSKIIFLENEKFSGLISDFFRTNNRNGIIEFMKSRFERNKMMIILKTMEGENVNE
jgi:hypothetical protein